MENKRLGFLTNGFGFGKKEKERKRKMSQTGVFRLVGRLADSEELDEEKRLVQAKYDEFIDSFDDKRREYYSRLADVIKLEMLHRLDADHFNLKEVKGITNNLDYRREVSKMEERVMTEKQREELTNELNLLEEKYNVARDSLSEFTNKTVPSRIIEKNYNTIKKDLDSLAKKGGNIKGYVDKTCNFDQILDRCRVAKEDIKEKKSLKSKLNMASEEPQEKKKPSLMEHFGKEQRVIQKEEPKKAKKSFKEILMEPSIPPQPQPNVQEVKPVYEEKVQQETPVNDMLERARKSMEEAEKYKQQAEVKQVKEETTQPTFGSFAVKEVPNVKPVEYEMAGLEDSDMSKALDSILSVIDERVSTLNRLDETLNQQREEMRNFEENVLAPKRNEKRTLEEKIQAKIAQLENFVNTMKSKLKIG